MVQKKRTTSTPVPRSIKGFGLVEIMVSLLLGMIILLAISELFVSNSRTRSEIEKSAIQLENGRFAIQLLADEIANAGFSGEASTPPFSAVVLPCAVPSDAAAVKDALGAGVYGGSVAGTCFSSSKANGEFVAIRRASTCSAGVGNCAALAEGHFHLQVAACESDWLNRPDAFFISKAGADLTARTRLCQNSQRAPVYRFLSRLFYVNDRDALVRRELVGSSFGTAEPLVEGIEMIAFEYGVDTAGDRAPESYVRAPSVTNWANVVSVRIWLVSRSLEPTAGYLDEGAYSIAGSSYSVSSHLNHKRTVHSMVVKLNSMAGRR